MKVKAYIHSLKDHEHDRHVLGEAEIIECIGDNLYLAEVNGVRPSSISLLGPTMWTMCTVSRRRLSMRRTKHRKER